MNMDLVVKLGEATVPFDAARAAVNAFPQSRERALALTKLDEAEMWLARAAAVQSPAPPAPKG